MNPRRVHELMRAHFASAGSANVDWHNLVDEHGDLIDSQIRGVLMKHFIEQGVKDVLVEVQRKVGGLVPVEDVTPYLQNQVGRGNIRIANREFTIFGEMVISGVGRSWQKP